MKRILLFIGTNLAVMLLISLISSALGVDRYLTRTGLDYTKLLIYSAIVGFSGSLFSLMISKWVAKWAYSIHVIEKPASQAEQWLVDKIRELSKKAGVAMPEVGVYESEEVNAFATGPTRNNALVAVSSGLIHNLNLRQIEGVLAHEMSHIANGDMVTMTLLQGVLNTFVVFFSKIIGMLIDHAMRGNDERRSGPGWGYMIGSLVAQLALGFFASLIVMAFSRHREFRADAMAAQLEGKDAMISALQRLNQLMHGGGVIDDRAQSVSAFKINHPSDGFLAALRASHPPLEDRIAALERLA